VEQIRNLVAQNASGASASQPRWGQQILARTRSACPREDQVLPGRPRDVLSAPAGSPPAAPAAPAATAPSGIGGRRRHGPCQAGQPGNTERIAPDVTDRPHHDQRDDRQAANQAVQRRAQQKANRACHVATFSSRVAKTTPGSRPGSRAFVDVPAPTTDPPDRGKPARGSAGNLLSERLANGPLPG